jgi:hypothetical protein
MNNTEAKFILQAYRPGGADAGDPTFSAALEQARIDPELNAWFAREQAFDAAVGKKLCAAEVPSGLREAILAGGRVTAFPVRPRAWWRRPDLLAAAAGIAILLSVGLTLWPRRAAGSVNLTDWVLDDAAHEERHGGHGAGNDTLRALLAQPDTPLAHGVRIDFDALKRSGCRTLQVGGRDVLEVCFQRDGRWFHCYIARRADFPALAAAGLTLIDRTGMGVASWADASHVYLVASRAGCDAIERLL